MRPMAFALIFASGLACATAGALAGCNAWATVATCLTVLFAAGVYDGREGRQ